MKKNVTKKIFYSAAATAVLASAGTNEGLIANASDDFSNADEKLFIEDRDYIQTYSGENYSSSEPDYSQVYSREPSEEEIRDYLTDNIHFGPQGAVNVQSVGKYRTQEGDHPDENGVAHLSWDVQWSPVLRNRATYSSVTWIFVPKELKNVTVEYRPIDSDETIPLQLSDNIPKVDDDFGDFNWDLSLRQNILRFDASLADKDYLDMLQLTENDAQKYQVVAIAGLDYSLTDVHTVRVSGDLDVTDAKSDVYVPLRATNRLTNFSFQHNDDEYKISGLSEYSWSNTGSLPEFSVEDKEINARNAELYKKAENSIAGLAGAEKCRTTVNTDSGDNNGGAKVGEILYDLLGSKDDVLIPPEDWIKLDNDYETSYPNAWINGPEDACDQSAHRILATVEPQESPTPTPSEDPTPSSSETPTPSTDPSPSESTESSPEPSTSEQPAPSSEVTSSEPPTPAPSEEPTPAPSEEPTADETEPTPRETPNIPEPEPRETPEVPEDTPRTTEPAARIIPSSPAPVVNPPAVNHTFPEKQPAPENPSRVNTPPFVPAPAPVQPAAIQGPVSEHGPVVNTGGAVHESFWTKIASIFR